jgi:hypothetical protein
MDFTHPDGIEPNLLNHAIWYAGHGFVTPYPGESAVLMPEQVTRGTANRRTAYDD